MMKLLLGTNNNGKMVEIREALGHLPLTIVCPADLSIVDAPTETGATFAENALQKARFYFSRSQVPTLADDSGIFVDALADELGIHTRRWGAGKDATDAEWIAHFLGRMCVEQNKRATFLCTLAFIDVDGTEHLFEGRCDGTITEGLEADYLPGLPISACFKPDGQSSVYSALSIEQKNRASHRGKALQLFEKYMSAKLENKA